MTLFIFKKKSIEVTFFTTNESAFRFSRPQKASHFIPAWWKRLPRHVYGDGPDNNVNNLLRTMKSCPGIVDLYGKGFIHPMWSDLNVDVESDGSYRYQYSDEVSVARDHPVQQMTGSHFNRSHNHLKLVSPWVAKEDTNVKFLMCAPVWNGFGAEDICVPPGVMSYKVPLELNINLFLRREAERARYEFKFGQPIAHFVPLSDKPLKLKYELISVEEKFKMNRHGGINLFFDNRQKKAAKLCPYA